MKFQKGLSLVELMISITVGLILLAGVTQVFLSNKAVYASQDSVSRTQETGRLAHEFLSRDIRMAGYTGCASAALGNVTNTLNNAAAFTYRFDVPVEGFDVNNDSGSATLPTDVVLSPAPLSGTDVLVVRGAYGTGVQVVSNNNSAQMFVEQTSTDTCPDGSTGYSGLCNSDILIVSDCSKARVFQATNVQASGAVLNVDHSGASVTPGNAVTSWGGNSAPDAERFGPDSEIIKISTVVYYIATSSTTGRKGLWQKIGSGTPVELLEGVANMQLLYGRDTDDDGVPDAFQTATVIAAANAWATVRSVKVSLLVESVDDNVVTDPQPYIFNSSTATTPTDKRLRRVITSSTGIRSRLK